MFFVPHFGHAKVYETSIWTPCFQISAKTLLSREIFSITCNAKLTLQAYCVDTSFTLSNQSNLTHFILLHTTNILVHFEKLRSRRFLPLKIRKGENNGDIFSCILMWVSTKCHELYGIHILCSPTYSIFILTFFPKTPDKEEIS